MVRVMLIFKILLLEHIARQIVRHLNERIITVRTSSQHNIELLGKHTNVITTVCILDGWFHCLGVIVVLRETPFTILLIIATHQVWGVM